MYANLVIEINKIIQNCNSYGHNIEHNRQLFLALLKSIIGEKLSIIGWGFQGVTIFTTTYINNLNPENNPSLAMT